MAVAVFNHKAKRKTKMPVHYTLAQNHHNIALIYNENRLTFKKLHLYHGSFTNLTFFVSFSSHPPNFFF